MNVYQGLKYLFLLTLFENISSYCFLQQNSVKKNFVLDFIKQYQTKINQRILSTNWMKIKLSDQAEVRRKIDMSTNAIQYFVEQLFERVRDLSRLLMAVITIAYICPMASVLIGFVYLCFYRFYSYRQSTDLLVIKEKMMIKQRKLHSKWWRITGNMFEYVIHHEKDKVIDITNQLKVTIQRSSFQLDFLYDYLEFKENLLGKFCTLLTICLHYMINGNITTILPLYHYSSTLTQCIHKLIASYIRWLKVKKDYDIIQPLLEDYKERINVEQIDLKYSINIKDLSFRYQQNTEREPFHLQLHGSLTFNMGQSILVTGKSGAGKSTFYDILNGSVPMSDYSAQIQIDDQQSSTLHSIEKCRTMVLQDSHMDYRSTIYSMITDIDEDDVKQNRTPELDELVWKFLRLVQIDDFVRDELKGNLDEAMENKLSGGQKTRLLLARALFRADQRRSPLLILDEPDKGLPAETTVGIIENIMKWYRSRGILFLTLHTERAHQLNFDQVLHVENGVITKIK